MTNNKKITISIVSVLAAVAVAISGLLVWRHSKNKYKNSEKVFISAIEDVNTALSFSLSGQCYSGVVESQKTYDVNYDTSKKIKEILVKEGDKIMEGAELFTYDIESMELEKEQAELEIERMNNEISSMQKQITELEAEKKKTPQEDQFSYTTQIQSLETDIAKVKYDIKIKNTEIEKLKNSVSNATVLAEISGTVQKINNIAINTQTDDMTDFNEGSQESANVVMTLVESGELRIRGKLNEQNMMFILDEMPVIIRSRTDNTLTWQGVISEISSEPIEDSDNIIAYEDMANDNITTSSNYNFYVTPQSIEGLILGQHIIIEPDLGQANAIEKIGIWLYEDYIATDLDNNQFVWSTDENARLEKRYVEIGQRDEIFGDCEILSGLEKSDSIAYPSNDYEEGMYTTTSIINTDLGNGAEDDIIDDGLIDGGDSLINDGEGVEIMPRSNNEEVE